VIAELSADRRTAVVGATRYTLEMENDMRCYVRRAGRDATPVGTVWWDGLVWAETRDWSAVGMAKNHAVLRALRDALWPVAMFRG
jgi:hypothetical protein